MIQFRSYRKKESHSLAIFLLILAVIIAFFSPRYLRPVASTLSYPFKYAAVTLWKGATGAPSFLIRLRHLSRENAALKQELQTFKLKILVSEELQKENDRLRRALGFKSRSPFGGRLIPAQVVGRIASSRFSILEINQGSAAGVRKNAVVVTEKGLVGKVIEIARFSSKIMLLSDAESKIAAVSSRSRDSGMVQGGHPGKLFMKYVAQEGDILEGDGIVTSQASVLFPAGISVGMVTRVVRKEHDLFYGIEIKPAVDFSKLEEVFVVI